MTAPETGGPSAIRVVSGNPTEEELAAVIAVISEQYAREVESATVELKQPRDTWWKSARTRKFPRQAWGR